MSLAPYPRSPEANHIANIHGPSYSDKLCSTLFEVDSSRPKAMRFDKCVTSYLPGFPNSKYCCIPGREQQANKICSLSSPMSAESVESRGVQEGTRELGGVIPPKPSVDPTTYTERFVVFWECVWGGGACASDVLMPSTPFVL